MTNKKNDKLLITQNIHVPIAYGYIIINRKGDVVSAQEIDKKKSIRRTRKT